MDPAKQKQRHPPLGVREIHWDIPGTLQGWTVRPEFYLNRLLKIDLLKKFPSVSF